MKLSINTGALMLGLFMAPHDLNSTYGKAEKGNLSGITVAEKYIEEDMKIKALFDLYSRLISKDVEDIKNMVGLYVDTDKNIGMCIGRNSDMKVGATFGGGGFR